MKVIWLLLFLLAIPAHAQYFGQNNVQYKKFTTYYLQSQHFDIYFTEKGRRLAEFVAETAEKAYRELRENFRYELTARITVIVYNSHNDFEQTNVVLSPGEESVGGFTEFFKNRIVIPFEGEWERLRHVIHHELTHAVMLQMLYGAGFQSIIMGLSQFQLPLWFIEGMAEFQSRGWDVESDNFMRDAVLHDAVPPLRELNGYFAYKGGQSLFHYIAKTFGRDKVGEVLDRVRFARNLEAGVMQALGLDLDELNALWQKDLRMTYWPDIARRDEPDEIARPLTNHRRSGHFINNSPAMSPDGRFLTFLSDRDDYFDIFLLDFHNGNKLTTLVSGQRSAGLEELHWLRPGLSWSPDGKHLIFAAKAGRGDALQVVDVARRKIVRTYRLDLDGIFSPTWSPRGDLIAFSGLQHGQSDIFLFNLNTGTLTKLTDDVFSDIEPVFSPDGRRLAFVSDRKTFTEEQRLPPHMPLHAYDYRNYDIYLADNLLSPPATLSRVTDTPFWERSPTFSPDGKLLAYTSDRSGIANIYVYNLEAATQRPLTNLVTGAMQLNWHRNGMAFVVFDDGGYDIYFLENPLLNLQAASQPQKTAFLQALVARRQRLQIDTAFVNVREDRHETRYQQLMREFAAERAKLRNGSGNDWAFLENKAIKTENGEFKVHKYKTKWSPDFALGSAGYSHIWGVQGAGQIGLSDLLGNHRLVFYTDLYYDFEDSDFYLRYFYLPHRLDIGVGATHQALFFRSHRSGLMRDRYFGINLYAAYPFSRYARMEYGANWLGIRRAYIEQEQPLQLDIRALILTGAYVRDTAAWGWTGPINGQRSEFRFTVSPRYQQHALEFLTLRGDLRKYYKIGRENTLAVRLAAGASGGKNPQQFLLGGVENWMNPSGDAAAFIENPDLIYFSSFEYPLRGTAYFEKSGNRFFLSNIEFRFPLIRYFKLAWPVQLRIAQIRGVIFTDIGAAWSRRLGKERFQPFQRQPDGALALKDVILGYGVGVRANLGIFVFRFDTAWNTDLANRFSKPSFYVSLGADY